MDLLAIHGEARDGFDRTVRGIGDDQWTSPTPCTEWTVRDLLNHLVYEQLWAPYLLRGATLDEVGDRFEGDVLGDDPLAAWTVASAEAHEAFTSPGALDGQVNVSIGKLDAEEYCWQMTTDLAVHGWDLAQATGQPQPITGDVAGALVAHTEPLLGDLQGIGIFAPPVAADPGADPASRLVALLGRDPGWRF